MNGGDIAPIRLELPGVRSISADLHKYGYCAKGAWTVFFRSAALLTITWLLDFNDWPGGRMIHSDTRRAHGQGGAISAAWAVMNFLAFKALPR